MSIEEIKKIDSSIKKLREFGLFIGLILLLIGVNLFLKDHARTFLYFYSALLIITTSFIQPKIFLPFQKIWQTVAIIIGYFMSAIILTAIYYVAFTLTGLIGRVFRKKFLNVKTEKELPSYWELRKKNKVTAPDYEKQY